MNFAESSNPIPARFDPVAECSNTNAARFLFVLSALVSFLLFATSTFNYFFTLVRGHNYSVVRYTELSLQKV